jgi:hypothetical protein
VQLRKDRSPLEETHNQAEVEDGIKCEEETIPQARPCIEGVEVQVVVVTDDTDHCKQWSRACGQGSAGTQNLEHHLPLQHPTAPWM